MSTNQQPDIPPQTSNEQPDQIALPMHPVAPPVAFEPTASDHEELLVVARSLDPATVASSPNRSPPAKARKQNSSEGPQSWPQPPHAIAGSPPQPPTVMGTVAAAQSSDPAMDGSLNQPRERLPPGMLLPRRDYPIPELHETEHVSVVQDAAGVVQHIHKSRKITRLQQLRDESAPYPATAAAASAAQVDATEESGSDPMSVVVQTNVSTSSNPPNLFAQTDPLELQKFQSASSNPPGPSANDYALVVERMRHLELENARLHEAYDAREQNFHARVQQFRNQASFVADQYQAAAATENAQARARADQAERSALQHREALVHAKEAAVRQTAQTEQQRQAQERREQEIVDSAQSSVTALQQRNQTDRQRAEEYFRHCEQQLAIEKHKEEEGLIRIQAMEERIAESDQRNLDLAVQLANQEANLKTLATERDGLKKEINDALVVQDQHRQRSSPHMSLNSVARSNDPASVRSLNPADARSNDPATHKCIRFVTVRCRFNVFICACSSSSSRVSGNP